MEEERIQCTHALVTRLNEDDQRLFLLDTLLVLPDELEHQYWTSRSIQQQQVVWDSLGLIVGLLANVLGLLGYAKGLGALNCKIGAACQLLQIVWLIKHKKSYIKYRYWTMIVQRVRWIVGQTLVTHAMTSHQLSSSIYSTPYKRATPRPGSWRAFFCIVVSSQLPAIVSSVSHMLPFRTQLLLAVFCVGLDLSAFHKRKVEIMDSIDMQSITSHACSFLRHVVLLDASSITKDLQDACMHNSSSFLLAYSHLVLGLLLPLVLAYWHEYSCKCRYLRAKLDQGHAPGRGNSAPVVRPALVLLYAWAWAAILWALVGCSFTLPVVWDNAMRVMAASSAAQVPAGTNHTEL